MPKTHNGPHFTRNIKAQKGQNKSFHLCPLTAMQKESVSHKLGQSIISKQLFPSRDESGAFLWHTSYL